MVAFIVNKGFLCNADISVSVANVDWQVSSLSYLLLTSLLESHILSTLFAYAFSQVHTLLYKCGFHTKNLYYSSLHLPWEILIYQRPKFQRHWCCITIQHWEIQRSSVITHKHSTQSSQTQHTYYQQDITDSYVESDMQAHKETYNFFNYTALS